MRVRNTLRRLIATEERYLHNKKIKNARESNHRIRRQSCQSVTLAERIRKGEQVFFIREDNNEVAVWDVYFENNVVRCTYDSNRKKVVSFHLRYSSNYSIVVN